MEPEAKELQFLSPALLECGSQLGCVRIFEIQEPEWRHDFDPSTLRVWTGEGTFLNGENSLQHFRKTCGGFQVINIPLDLWVTSLSMSQIWASKSQQCIPIQESRVYSDDENLQRLRMFHQSP